MPNCPQCFCGPSEPKGHPLWLCLGCGAFWEETPKPTPETDAPAPTSTPKPWTPEELQMMAWEFYQAYGYYPQ